MGREVAAGQAQARHQALTAASEGLFSPVCAASIFLDPTGSDNQGPRPWWKYFPQPWSPPAFLSPHQILKEQLVATMANLMEKRVRRFKATKPVSGGGGLSRAVSPGAPPGFGRPQHAPFLPAPLAACTLACGRLLHPLLKRRRARAPNSCSVSLGPGASSFGQGPRPLAQLHVPSPPGSFHALVSLLALACVFGCPLSGFRRRHAGRQGAAPAPLGPLPASPPHPSAARLPLLAMGGSARPWAPEAHSLSVSCSRGSVLK